MGIVLLRQRIGINLEDILSVVLIDTVQLILVSFFQRRGNLFGWFIGNLQAQRLILEPFSPAIVQISLIGSPGHGRVIDNQMLVDVVIKSSQRLWQLFKNAL